MANTPQVGWHILLDENEWDRDDPGAIPNEDRSAVLACRLLLSPVCATDARRGLGRL